MSINFLEVFSIWSAWSLICFFLSIIFLIVVVKHVWKNYDFYKWVAFAWLSIIIFFTILLPLVYGTRI